MITLPSPFELRIDELRLRPWSASDAAPLATFADDPSITRWNPFTQSGDSIEGWLSRRIEWTDHCSWAIVDEHGALAGSVSLFQFDATNLNGQIGYWTSPQFRRRGIATRAVTRVARFAFDELSLVRIGIFHAVDNVESCGVALRAGFALEGTTRQSWRYPDGQLHDEHIHARLATDA